MKEQLIEFETSKLANSKGFTRKLIGYSLTTTRRNYYNDKGILNGDCLEFIKDCLKYGRDEAKRKHILYPACSQSLLQKWLREEHNIHCWLIPAEIDKTYRCYVGSGIKLDLLENIHTLSFKTYEEALEKGLQEALKLINEL